MGLEGLEPPTVRVKAARATVAPQAQSGAVCVFLVFAASSSLVHSVWWAEQDSNLRQLVCRTSVLAAELPARALCSGADRENCTPVWGVRSPCTAAMLCRPNSPNRRTAQDLNLTPRGERTV